MAFMINRTEHIIQFAETVDSFTATQYAQTLEPDVSLHSIVNILNRMVRQGKLQRLQKEFIHWQSRMFGV